MKMEKRREMVFDFNSSCNFVQDRIYPWDRKFGKFFT